MCRAGFLVAVNCVCLDVTAIESYVLSNAMDVRENERFGCETQQRTVMVPFSVEAEISGCIWPRGTAALGFQTRYTQLTRK